MLVEDTRRIFACMAKRALSRLPTRVDEIDICVVKSKGQAILCIKVDDGWYQVPLSRITKME